VAAALVRRAVQEFADTGRRPTCLAWQGWERGEVESGSEWPGF
jgi:hypothetical protein